MESITLSLFNHGKWWDVADVTFHGESTHKGVTITYRYDYLIACSSYEAIDINAISINAPVSIIPVEYPTWPALFDDLLPVGKSREWWLRYLNSSRLSEFKQNFLLLTHACTAPIGNIRVKQSLDIAEAKQSNIEQRFPISDVVQLQYDFLQYANEKGAAIGGATGAGGVAPKLLLMVQDDEVYIDDDFAGKPLSATPYLTKFARNTRSEVDNNILKAEGVFYQALTQILDGTSIQTIKVQKMMQLEHNGQASLWLPRFDIEINNGIAQRIGVESIYSIINAEPGSYQDHFTVMEEVWRKIKHATTMTAQDFINNYVARDLLNQVFGNSDNHGRNISFLKKANDIQFAPIYDFAPMKADPEVITRLFKWGRNCEQGGVVNFKQVATELANGTFAETRARQSYNPDNLIDLLTKLSEKMMDLPAQLETLGCPEQIINFPAIGFHNTKARLVAMGIING